MLFFIEADCFAYLGGGVCVCVCVYLIRLLVIILLKVYSSCCQSLKTRQLLSVQGLRGQGVAFEWEKSGLANPLHCGRAAEGQQQLSGHPPLSTPISTSQRKKLELRKVE